jgi:hypothetical protein
LRMFNRKPIDVIRLSEPPFRNWLVFRHE